MTHHGRLSDRPLLSGQTRRPIAGFRALAIIRRFCFLWFAMMAWLLFQPMPTRAQPEAVRTAMRPTSTESSPRGEPAPIPTGVGNSRHLDAPPPRLLVLTNGRVVDGRISQNGGGYMVDKPNGSLLVPFDRVSFEASDFQDAYRKLRASLPADSNNSNMAMARWCLSYSLYDEAESELRHALQRNPADREARSMLTRLDELRNPSGVLTPSSDQTETRTDDGFEMPEVESLGGYSRSAVQLFVTRIQPILWNNCGNASCHGGDGTRHGFALSPVRNGRSNRILAERNLAAVLKEIDPSAPDRSTLLTVPRGAHGGGRSVFSGTRGGEQFDAVRDWVRLIAKEIRANGLEAGSRPSLAARGADRIQKSAHIRPEAQDDSSAPPSILIESAGEKSRLDPPRSLGSVGADSKEVDPLDQIRQELKPDAFDPAEFNRQNGSTP